eukprot:1876090-Rhodomonas_salina.2
MCLSLSLSPSLTLHARDSDMKGLGDFSTPTDERVNAYQGTPADYESWPDFQVPVYPDPT